MSTESQQPPTAPADTDGGLLSALVAAERASMRPPEEGEHQTWERVVASVAVGSTPPVPPSSISGPTTAGSSLWVKVVLGVIVGGMVAAAGYRLSTTAAAPTPPTASSTAVRPEPEPPPPVAQQPRGAPVGANIPAAPPIQRAAPATPRSPPQLAPEHPGGTAAPTKPRPAPSQPSPSSDLTEETRLLAQARGRLRAGSPRQALPALTEHARRFPNGQLTEDRIALQAQTLCEAGDVKAGLQKAAALRKAFPSSSHLPRVHRACR